MQHVFPFQHKAASLRDNLEEYINPGRLRKSQNDTNHEEEGEQVRHFLYDNRLV